MGDVFSLISVLLNRTMRLNNKSKGCWVLNSCLPLKRHFRNLPLYILLTLQLRESDREGGKEGWVFYTGAFKTWHMSSDCDLIFLKQPLCVFALCWHEMKCNVLWALTVCSRHVSTTWVSLTAESSMIDVCLFTSAMRGDQDVNFVFLSLCFTYMGWRKSESEYK